MLHPLEATPDPAEAVTILVADSEVSFESLPCPMSQASNPWIPMPDGRSLLRTVGLGRAP